MKLGNRVRSRIDFNNVPAGTEGIICEDYGTGVTVAWDLPDRPIPNDWSLKDIATAFAVEPKCPLRDGFDKSSELNHLEVIG